MYLQSLNLRHHYLTSTPPREPLSHSLYVTKRFTRKTPVKLLCRAKLGNCAACPDSTSLSSLTDIPLIYRFSGNEGQLQAFKGNFNFSYGFEIDELHQRLSIVSALLHLQETCNRDEASFSINTHIICTTCFSYAPRLKELPQGCSLQLPARLGNSFKQIMHKSRQFSV